MSGLEVQPQLVVRGRQIPIVFGTAHRDQQVGRARLRRGRLPSSEPVDHEELVRLELEALGEH